MLAERDQPPKFTDGVRRAIHDRSASGIGQNDTMEAARTPLAGDLDQSSRLVRVLEQTGIGLRNGAEAGVVSPDGFVGQLMNGVLNGMLRGAAPGRVVVEATTSDAEAEANGLVCGGSTTLLVSPLSDLPPDVSTWMGQAQAVALVCRADGSGQDLAVTRKDSSGTLGDPALDQTAMEAARVVLATGTSQQVIRDAGGERLLIAAAIPQTHALIVGSGPMAEAIHAQGSLMGWTVQVSEDRTTAVEFCGIGGPPDALILISHDPDVYTPALSAALRSSLGYVGAMGSRDTQKKRHDALVEAGHSAEEIGRIYGPIGLDLGSRTPQETAVAIAAEFLAHRAGGKFASLSTHFGPIHR